MCESSSRIGVCRDKVYAFPHVATPDPANMLRRFVIDHFPHFELAQCNLVQPVSRQIQCELNLFAMTGIEDVKNLTFITHLLNARDSMINSGGVRCTCNFCERASRFHWRFVVNC